MGIERSLPGGSDSKESACHTGDLGSIPGSGRSPRGGHGNPLQCSCLQNPMDKGAWQATVHGVTKSQTWLSDYAHTANHVRSRILKNSQLGRIFQERNLNLTQRWGPAHLHMGKSHSWNLHWPLSLSYCHVPGWDNRNQPRTENPREASPWSTTVPRHSASFQLKIQYSTFKSN